MSYDVATLHPRSPHVKSAGVSSFEADMLDDVVLEEVIAAALHVRGVRSVCKIIVPDVVSISSDADRWIIWTAKAQPSAVYTQDAEQTHPRHSVER